MSREEEEEAEEEGRKLTAGRVRDPGSSYKLPGMGLCICREDVRGLDEEDGIVFIRGLIGAIVCRQRSRRR